MKIGLVIFLLLPSLLKAQIITTVVGNGTAGYSGDGGYAATAELNRPINIKFDHLGNMYVADDNNNVIRKINSAGIITTVVGNGYGAGSITLGGYSGDGGQATAAELWGPVDVAFDAVGNLYTDDNGNAVIRKVNTSGVITTVAGGGTSGLGDNGPATAAQLSDPVGLVFDNSGNLYFSDAGHYCVRKINTDGIISTIAGNGAEGYSGDGGPATAAKLSIPQFLAIGPSGDLYIPDWENNRVRVVNSLGIISTVAGNGIGINNNDGTQATAASIKAPDAIVFDDLGNYYISSVDAGTIRKVNTVGIITTVVGNDTPGYRGDGGPAIDAEINGEAICSAVDGGGNLFIADSKNNRIRRVTYNAEGVKEVNAMLQNATIYPNPAHNEITIKATDKIESIEILNLVGQVVYKQSYSNASNAEVAISSFANGVYFVKVNGVYRGKFLKQ